MKKIEDKGRRWSAMFDWHVAMGCTRCSPACSQCASARWLSSLHSKSIDKLIERVDDKGVVASLFDEKRCVSVFNGTVRLRPNQLKQPLYLHDGAQVFVAGCSDLFHKDVPFDYVRKVAMVVQARPSIVFFVLTRRPERAVQFATEYGWPDNFWIGTSAENQRLFDYRVGILGDMPAKYRVVSIKPMMGPVDITKAAGNFELIIVGGQSGRGAFPMHPDWVRKVRDDCAMLDVPLQFHQWGVWGVSCGPTCDAHIWITDDGNINRDGIGTIMHRVGSKISGLDVDGQEWDQYPDTYKGLNNATDIKC